VVEGGGGFLRGTLLGERSVGEGKGGVSSKLFLYTSLPKRGGGGSKEALRGGLFPGKTWFLSIYFDEKKNEHFVYWGHKKSLCQSYERALLLASHGERERCSFFCRVPCREGPCGSVLVNWRG